MSSKPQSVAGGRRELAAALAVGRTVREAAAAANASERSVYSWLKQDDFRGRVEELRSALVAEVVAKLKAGMNEAADALRALLGDAAAGIRLRAAAELLAGGFKALDRDVEERLRALEERQAGRTAEGYRADPA